MTVAALTQTRAQISGDGVTDRIDVTFQFVDETDLKVIHTDADGTDTEWVYGQSPGSWSFTGGDYAAGTLHFTASDLDAGERLTVVLTSQYDQALSLDGGEIDPSVLERGMDRSALHIQAIAGDVSRSLRIAASAEGDPIDLEVKDLPEGYGFVREGDALVPAQIDSAGITASVEAAETAQAAAETAQGSAETAQEAAETARTGAETAQGVAEAAATAAAQSAASFDTSNLATLSGGNTFTGDQMIHKSEPARTLKDSDGSATHRAIREQLINGTLLWQTLDHENNLVSTDFQMTLGASGVEEWNLKTLGEVRFKIASGGSAFFYGDVYVGRPDVDANSNIFLWDEANFTRRTLRWNRDANRLECEDGDGKHQGLHWTCLEDVAMSGDDTWNWNDIPEGVSEIELVVLNASLNGAGDWMVRLRDAGGIEATNYISSCSYVKGSTNTTVSADTGFIVYASDASVSSYFIVRMSRYYNLGNNSVRHWAIDIHGVKNGGTLHGFGRKFLSANLDGVHLQTVGNYIADNGIAYLRYR